MNTPIRILVAALLCFGLVACKKAAKPEETTTDTTTTTTTTDTVVDNGMYGPDDLDTDSCLRQRVVYFDFDQADVRPEFQAIMACHGKYMTDRPTARITLEGHADERGTREYNLGLGERRGNAVSDMLSANGGSAEQLSVVSYGEERPTCSESDESCWSKNRRVEIIYTAK